ncbi:LuxR C-terminal-related transcriptional regulator [Streptomyces sp. JB150]|uniref:helix-turn-helix transcriptional regulator n=1 Tax=Streptomyces sp. JB150 TaxID=2714844 RepID=UPI00140A3590|nr:LuxR C-terminal-related transcriptional regulator [Streptomyces sp. JB150]QIJ65460.1 response regulator transcription factor [Streptomyces sp. JB150]
MVDPDPASRALLSRFAERGGEPGSLLSAASAADIPLGRVNRPVTLILSSAAGVGDLSLLGRLIADPETRVVLILRSLMQNQLDTAQWVLADAVLRLEDVQSAALDEVLPPQGRGTVAVSPEVLRRVVQLASAKAEGEVTRPRLTERETEALWGAAQGMSNRQIARGMGITEHGVKRHLANVMSKLNCQSRTAAVAVALRSGLLELDGVGRDAS